MFFDGVLTMKTKKTKKIMKTKKTVKARKALKPKKLSGATKTTTVFSNGQSQAVRIPKEFRMAGKKVYIQKIGNQLIITPAEDLWTLFCEALNGFSDDFMKDGREQLPPQERDWSCFK